MTICIIVTALWGGGLLVAHELRAPAAPSPVSASVDPSPAALKAVAATPSANPVATGMFSGIESSPGPAIVDGLPSIDDRRQKIESFWAQANGNDPNGPHGRWEDRTGILISATMPSTAPSDPLLTPTLVSVHIKDLSSRSAMSRLSKQTGVRFSLDQNQYWQGRPYPKISLDADNKPLLEVVNEFCCKTGLQPAWGSQVPAADPAHPRMTLTLQNPDNAMGPWEISGPFSFEVQQVSHAAELSGDGNTASPVHLTFGVQSEPGVVLLSMLKSPVVTEAVDEKGHRLTGVLPEAPQLAQPQQGFLSSLFFGARHGPTQPLRRAWAFNHQPMWLDLTCPPDVGRTIVRLRATEEFLVQTNSETVETAVKSGETAPPKDVGGISYIVGLLTVMSPQQITCQITFKRGKRSAEDFDAFTAAIYDRRPTLLDDQGNAITNMQNVSTSSDGDSVAFNLYWYPQNGGPTEDAGDHKPAKLVLDIPTQWKTVSVPIQFDNLPLP